MARIKYPIGIQDFEKLIEGGYLYVDKTGYIDRLVEEGAIYFLSRPRRFGKSLLLSTMEAFFTGKRDLFRGLAIDDREEWDWEPRPVIHIDLNAKDYTDKESLYDRINEHLTRYESKYGIGTPAGSPDERFRTLIEKAYIVTGKRVVVLIDEYDKPILDTQHEEGLKEMHRNTLRAFYSSLKSCDGYLEFCFLTGVTKFGQMNIFSGLNNLRDISLDDAYSGICGITEEELHGYFREGVSECAEKWHCTEDEGFAILKENYDGYHFSTDLLDVYNPWSVMNAVVGKRIDMYWNRTGGGLTMLYRLLESGKIMLGNLDNVKTSLHSLQGTQEDITDAISLLYQTGYLTIKSYDLRRGLATLGYPNREVETGFLEGLLPAYSGVSKANSVFAINEFINDLESGNTDIFMERMRSFFADFSYENALKSEKDFQNIMYCVARLMGLQTKLEYHSAMGSADMVIETSRYVYVMEFKVDKSPEEALKQIESKGYALPYSIGPRRLIKVGVEFSINERNLADWTAIES